MNQARLSVEQVATRTGLSARSVYNLINDGTLVARGTPLRIDEDAVTQLITNRHIQTAAKIGNLERFAEEVRRRMQPPIGLRGTDLPMDQDARALWGPHVVKAAGLPDGAGCRWCWARLTATVHGGFQPTPTDAHRILLGEPCRKDLAVMREQLGARRRPRQAPTENTPPARTAAAKPKTGPSRYAGTKACGVPVGTRCECHTSDRPGGPQPARQDKGTALTAARRKTLTAAIKSAQDRGDRKHAQELRGLLAALSPQAVRASKPTSGTHRSEPHGCGCQCPRHRSQP